MTPIFCLMILRFHFRRFIGSRKTMYVWMYVKYFHVTTNDTTSICSTISLDFFFVSYLNEKRAALMEHVFVYVHEYSKNNYVNSSNSFPHKRAYKTEKGISNMKTVGEGNLSIESEHRLIKRVCLLRNELNALWDSIEIFIFLSMRIKRTLHLQQTMWIQRINWIFPCNKK